MAKSINNKENVIKSKHLEDAFLNVMRDNGMDNGDLSVTIKTPKYMIKEKEPFIKMFQKGLNIIIMNGISPAGCKMFLYFMVESYYGNFVEIDQRKIQDKLGMSRTSINKSINELVQLNIIGIMPDMNDRRRNTYTINPYVAWKGNPLDRQKHITHGKDFFMQPKEPTLFIQNNSEE